MVAVTTCLVSIHLQSDGQRERMTGSCLSSPATPTSLHDKPAVEYHVVFVVGGLLLGAGVALEGRGAGAQTGGGIPQDHRSLYPVERQGTPASTGKA